MILSNKKEIKRLAIYFFYDEDGVVDEYIPCMLKELNKNITELLIVCNGCLTSKSRLKLEQYTSNILLRENKGFDVWAYKEAIEFYGWNNLEKFDEIILLNFTIMGPIYTFSDMFDEMNKKNIDFWGITMYNGSPTDPFGIIKYGYIPPHIQSHFMVLRKNIFNSQHFKKYWKEIPKVNSYSEAIAYHEAIFTKYFENLGYKWCVYVDTKDLVNFTDYPLLMMPKNLIENRKCPIIKRRSFFHDYNNYLSQNNGEASVELLEYIDKNNLYDINLIWENILRTKNMSDIKNCLQLNYILPTNIFNKSLEKDIISKKIALIMHIYFEELIEYCFDYAKSMPPNSDIYITTDSEKKKNKIEKIFKNYNFKKFEIIVIENRGRDISALLVSTKEFIMDYDYVCFAHDKKVGQLDLGIKGEAFSYKCFENILKNQDYVFNIINTFENNSKLGLLTPPPPNHADYYPTIGLEWGYNYEIVLELYNKLQLSVPIDREKEPIAPLGTMFWFRPKSLKRLFEQDWKYEDFPKEPNNTDGTLLHAIERIYPFVAQEEGFYCAWVMADTFARIEINNLNFMLKEINRVAFKIYGLNSHYGLISTMKYSIMQNKKNNTMESDILLRKLLKEKIKRKVPKAIWNFIKKIYHVFNGKRWIG